MLVGESMESQPFDAAEKLLEIEVRRGSGSLRALGAGVWSAVVEASGGAILGSVSGAEVDAHVLSESSLFVWDHAASLLTCGRTDVVRAFEALVEHVGEASLAGVRLSREADRFPGSARTRFEDDVKRLASRAAGAVVESRSETAALRSFEAGRPTGGLRFRIFCRGLGEAARREFLGAVAERPRRLEAIERIVGAELVQRHRFAPSGYSLNAVKSGEALCVHVSPETSADVATVEATTSSAELRLALLDEAERAFEPAQLAVTLDGRYLVTAAEARGHLAAARRRSEHAHVV